MQETRTLSKRRILYKLFQNCILPLNKLYILINTIKCEFCRYNIKLVVNIKLLSMKLI